MDVIFQPSRGNPFSIEVGYFDTVLEIKEKIQKNQNIPISKQTLVFNGNTLQDDLNIHDSDVLDRSRIRLLIASDHNNITKTDDPVIPTTKVHANGIEMRDRKSVQDCQVSDGSEIDVGGVVRSCPPPPAAPASSSSGSAGGVRKMRIVVSNKCGAEKIPVDVSSSENVGELRKKLQKIKLDLPREGYFFIFKQNVMDDDRSFRWHHVGQGDTIEIFSGNVS